VIANPLYIGSCEVAPGGTGVDGQDRIAGDRDDGGDETRMVPKKMPRRSRSSRAPATELDALGAALLVVDGGGAVVHATGWQSAFPSSAPDTIPPEEEAVDPVTEALARAIAESRRRGGPSHSVVEISLARQRFYSIAAAPAGAGNPPGTTLVMALEVTDAFQPGPREGAAIRQLGHDLKSPLTSMSGAVEMLQSGRFGTLNGQQERLLAMMQKGIDMMMTLIDEAAAPYRETRGDEFMGRGRAATSGER